MVKTRKCFKCKKSTKIFRRTFKENTYLGHSKKQIKYSIHCKDLNQIKTLLKIFKGIGFQLKSIDNKGPFPIKHWILFPKKKYYSCSDCFMITLIIYPQDVHYNNSLKRF